MKFTIRCHNETKGYFKKRIEGEPIDLLEGYKFFLHATAKDDGIDDSSNEWTISEASTGYAVALGATKEGVTARAQHNLRLHRGHFIHKVSEAIRNNKIFFAK